MSDAERLRAAAQLEGLAESSIQGYLTTLRVMGDLRDAEEVKRRMAARNYKPSSLAIQWARVATCCRLLGIPDATAGVRRPRRVRANPKPLTDEQFRILDDALREPFHSWLILGSFAGLRAAEISGLRGSDLELWRSGWKVRVRGKGGTILTVPAHPRVVEVFQAHSTDGRLWPDTTPKTVSRRFRDACHRAGVRASLHQTRHLFATTLWLNTHDVFTVQAALRHASPVSTQAYVALDDRSVADAVAGL